MSFSKSIFVLIALALGLFKPQQARADDISWNGFGSAYYGQAVKTDFLPLGFNSTHANFTSFSLLGLNLSDRIVDKLSVNAQFLALGLPVGSADSYAFIVQWAYLYWQPFKGLGIKGGRQLMPSTIDSEYARVGYLLPFRQNPVVLQTVPFTRFDGLSVDESFGVGIGKLTLGAFFGTPQLDFNTTLLPPGLNYLYADALGVTATLAGDGWRARSAVIFNYNHANNATAPYGPGGTEDAHRTTVDVGARYDKHNVVAWLEYINTSAQNAGLTPYGDAFLDHGESYYALLGYRIGAFMPRYTYGRGSEYFGLGGNHGQSWDGQIYMSTIGVNWQVARQAIIKLEMERNWIGTPDSAGLFGVNGTVTTPSTTTSGDAYYLGVDFIF